MISLAIFPCRFTDSARIFGELSYTLSLPVYSDQLILMEMAEQLNITVEKLQQHLFFRTHRASNAGILKDRSIQLARNRIETLCAADTEYLYYGFFMSLIDQADSLTHRLLIYADEKVRVQRAIRQEQMTEPKALKAIREHDRKAACWSNYLLDSLPYAPELFDAVVRYEHQDLLDVVASICLLFEHHIQKTVPHYCVEACGNLE